MAVTDGKGALTGLSLNEEDEGKKPIVYGDN